MSQIDDGLAIAIAGMISSGLAQGNNQDERAAIALVAVAIMLKNSTDNPRVHHVIDLAQRLEINRDEYGVLHAKATK